MNVNLMFPVTISFLWKSRTQ